MLRKEEFEIKRLEGEKMERLRREEWERTER
jgi:hypothetical protein